MKLLILVSLVVFVSAENVPDSSKFSPVYGYLTRFSIPEAERIEKAEEAYLNSLSLRIGGGSPATPEQIPYQAGLISEISNQTRRGVCGASILNSKQVLTAAHCWFDGLNQAWRFTVVVGSNLLFRGGTRLLTSAVNTHPDWSPSLARNDIAIVNLPSNLAFTDAIAPVSLPTGTLFNRDFANSQATISGFGLTYRGDAISSDQFSSYAGVNVISNSICILTYPTVLQDSHICTDSSRSRPDVGDSGGPLVTVWDGKNILIGVASFKSSKSMYSPFVYTRVTSFIDFIQKNLK